jgi:serine/threonine-protein kinase
MDPAGRQLDQIPQTIGRYQVLDAIGFGAMGAVYKAFDPLIKRSLAIKTIRLDVSRGSPQYKSFIDRFYHEARISGTLSHPNIVTLFDIGEENGVPFLAMEYVEGETLATIIDRGERFRPERVIGLVSQVAAAVDYAHGRGVVHRDIKPSNLILAQGDKLKVTDFGIAKLANAEMTQSGTLLGTPSYMSPEQAMGDKIDGRSDIFALGVCAFEMLSGEQPFPGSNVTSILYKLVHDAPVQPANLALKGLVPEKWHDVFGKVLAKRPDDRYQTSAEFVQDLEYCLGGWFGAPVEAAGVAPAEPPPRPAAAVEAKTNPPVPVAAPPPAPPGPTADRILAAAEVAFGPKPGVEPPAAEVVAATMISPPPQAPAAPEPVRVPGSRPGRSTDELPRPGARAEEEAGPAPPTPLPMPMPEAADGAEATLLVASSEAATLVSAPPRAEVPVVVEPVPVVLPAAARGPEAPARPRPGRTPIPVALSAGGVVAFLGLAVLGWLWRGRSEEAPSPAPAASVAAPPSVAPPPPLAAPTSGTIAVASEPAGAAVLLDGVEKGVTPLEVADVAFGEHELRVELKGYAPERQIVVLAADAPRHEAAVTLGRATQPTGTVDFTSNPSGAAIRLDGANLGVTPLLGRAVRVGSRQVEIRKDGFEPWTGALQVSTGRKAAVVAQLRAIVVASPSPSAAPPSARPAPAEGRPVAEEDLDQPLRRVSGDSPRFPGQLRSKERVSVVIALLVTEKGEVGDVSVVESAGRNVDAAVLAAVRTWKFVPPTRQGRPVKARVTRKQTFEGA